ncbi:tetratricopeptide repeat protein [Candidatus Sumerlaeota bacterium]|nr:tetratricopeptide repeat protein [Candidatus Sumerlaeota bacterium]
MKKERILLIIILSAGLFLRILFCIQFRETPFYEYPTLDARYYDLLGKKVARGEIIHDRAFFMGPFYPYSLGFLYFLFGDDFLIPRIAQMLLGMVCIGFVYITGRSLFSPGVGLFAAGLYAIYKPALFYEQTLLSETPMAMFCLLFLFIVFQADQKKKGYLWLLSGFTLGILALFRGNVLLFAPILILWTLYSDYGIERRIITKRSAVKLGWLVTGMILGILPATLHNYMAERSFVLVTSNAGFNMYIGNQKNSKGLFFLPPRVDMDQDPSGSRVAEMDTGIFPLNSSDVSRYWAEKAVSQIRRHPLTFLKLCILKFYYFWGRVEIPQIYSMRMMRRFMPALKLPLTGFFLIGPLCLVGFLRALILPDRRKIVFMLFIGVYILSLLPFFMTARYRLPVIPVLCLFAADALLGIAGLMQKRQWNRLWAYIAGFIFLSLLLNNSFLFSGKEEAVQFHNALGLIYKSKEKIKDAEREFRESISAKPGSYALSNLATLYYDQQDHENAAIFYEKALSLEPDNARIHFNAAQNHLAKRDFDKARESFEKANALDSRVNPLSYFNLALIYARKGDKQKAKDYMKTYLSYNPKDQKARDILNLW